MQTVQSRSLPLRLPRVRPGGVLPILVILGVLLVLVGIRQPDFLAPRR